MPRCSRRSWTVSTSPSSKVGFCRLCSRSRSLSSPPRSPRLAFPASARRWPYQIGRALPAEHHSQMWPKLWLLGGGWLLPRLQSSDGRRAARLGLQAVDGRAPLHHRLALRGLSHPGRLGRARGQPRAQDSTSGEECGADIPDHRRRAEHQANIGSHRYS